MSKYTFFLFSRHCFLSHFTPQYPQLTRLSTQPLFILAYLLPLSLAQLPQQKHHLNLLSSISKALLTHTLASFWRKQSCCHLLCQPVGDVHRHLSVYILATPTHAVGSPYLLQEVRDRTNGGDGGEMAPSVNFHLEKYPRCDTTWTSWVIIGSCNDLLPVHRKLLS